MFSTSNNSLIQISKNWFESNLNNRHYIKLFLFDSQKLFTVHLLFGLDLVFVLVRLGYCHARPLLLKCSICKFYYIISLFFSEEKEEGLALL